MNDRRATVTGMAVSAIAFDTHRFVKRLTDAGMEERQAEVLADEQVALLNTNLATKTELGAVEARLQEKIATVEANLREKIATVEANLQEKIATVEANLQEKIATVEADLKREIATLGRDVGGVKVAVANVKVDIANVKADLLKWMVGALIAQGGVIVGLIRLLS